ncbi:MAG TPA: glycosyltransferase family 4 protein [Steroidobacteraceae bacterium]|nr:glycosyltransferase family 4 protein [Steroidobacteraceae bacterium]
MSISSYTLSGRTQDGPCAEEGASSLLLDVGVPFRVQNGEVYVESQAHHGIRQWLENFRSLTLCAPVVPEQYVDSTMQWVPAADLLAEKRFSTAPLPWGYDVRSHIAQVAHVRRVFRELIPKHSHLCFSNLGWLGAWGRIGCEEAHRLQRPYAIWLDWVLHEMPARVEQSALKRSWRSLQTAMLKHKSVRDIRRASLGLFNGRTVFEAYAALCKVPRVAHDIHLGVNDVISTVQLERRLARESGPLKIIYVGRVHEMKGPWHWLDAMEAITSKLRAGRGVQATWLGDGPLLSQAQEAVRSRNLLGRVSFAGPQIDRQRLLAMLRNADLFVFCHLTPESPRCLIEALMSGLPIVGFESAYASGLLGEHAPGGLFVRRGDTEGLADAVVDALSSPERLRSMSRAAHAAGMGFSDVAVFKHRSDLIKEFA